MKCDLDSKLALESHHRIIRSKEPLKKLYSDFYKILTNTFFPKGPIVEIGSGAGFMKEIMPNVITSDIVEGEGIDKIFSATRIPFPKTNIAGFVMFDVLHHIKDPEKAFREMQRCLKVGGKIVMIEPYNSLWGGVVYKYLHYENFNPQAGWHIKGSGRMSDSNTALPWIIFVRDRKLFEKKFPRLKIIHVSPHTPFLYLLTGGLSKPQLFPTFLYPTLKFVEKLISSFNTFIGMFVTVEIEKT